jgi:ribosomal protein L24
VGAVVKPGTATSRVRIMYGDEDFGTPKSVKIPNNNINKITKEDFESRALKYGDAVNVTGGKHAGKTGKVTYFYSTGTVEMSTSDGGYMEAKLNNVNLASALAADSTDSSEIKKDDKVTITAGLYKGLTGTVAIMGAGSLVMVDLGNHSVNIRKDELKKEKATAALSTNTISVGDSVKIISGSDVGTIGVITKLGKGGTYIKLDNGDNMYVFNSTIEKIDGPDDDLIDLDDIDFETFDEPDKSIPPVKNDVPNFTEGDKVKVTSGPNAGKTGKVSYVWLSMPVIDVKFDDGGFQGDIPYADLEVVGEDTIKFKQGDIVNIKDPAFDFKSLYDSLKLKNFQFRLRVNAAHYFPVGKSATIKTAIQAGLYKSPFIFRNELFRKKNYTLFSELDLKKENKFTTLVIGDSFSEQGSYGYKNYLADSNDLSVLHFDRFSNANPLELLSNILNGDVLDHIQIKYVVLQSIEREMVKRGLELNKNGQLKSDSLIRLFKANQEKKKENESEKETVTFKVTSSSHKKVM